MPYSEREFSSVAERFIQRSGKRDTYSHRKPRRTSLLDPYWAPSVTGGKMGPAVGLILAQEMYFVGEANAEDKVQSLKTNDFDE